MTRLSRRPDALWRATPDSVVVLGPRAERPTAVTGPAAILWEVLAEPIEERDAVARVAERFAAEADVVAEDVAPVLEAWRRDGAVDEV